MEQYISKSALLSEIDRQKIGYNVDGKHSVEYDITRKIIDIINTLEAKEVDLDKEIDEWIAEGYSPVDTPEIAKHFFELGLKTQKPAFETDNSIGSPDYERGFKHGRDFQAEIDAKNTDTQKVINYLIKEKGYPINTQGDIPSYEETFRFALNALEAQKGE